VNSSGERLSWAALHAGGEQRRRRIAGDGRNGRPGIDSDRENAVELALTMGKMMATSVRVHRAGEVACHGAWRRRAVSSLGTTEPGSPALGSRRRGAEEEKDVMASLLVKSTRRCRGRGVGEAQARSSGEQFQL
jgi:hypothetical protein